MHDQRPTAEVHAGEHPLARLGFVIGQRPTGEVHGRVTGIVQLDPVADIPLIILQPIAVGGEKLVDDHLAKCVVGLHIVVPALGNQLVRLRCDIRHAVAFRPGDGHRAALHRFKLNLPRPAGHTGNRQRRLAIDAQVGGIETTYRFTEKQAHPVQPAYVPPGGGRMVVNAGGMSSTIRYRWVATAAAASIALGGRATSTMPWLGFHDSVAS